MSNNPEHWYNNNPLLIKANIPRNYTIEELDELERCRNDIVYFCMNYVKIINVDEGIINFKMWDFQKELVRRFDENRFNICLMPRQVGKTTTTVSYILHYILFNEQVNVAILANKGPTAREILGRLQLAFENLPDFLKHGVVVWNKGNIELENGSKVLATSTSASSIRGSSFNIIFLDELAHVQNNIAEEFFTSTYPAISSGKTTKIIIVSTPNGMNMFYKMWTKAVDGKSLYVPTKIHWSEVPGRDKAWKEETIKNTSEDQFRQEFEVEFLGSTDTLISATKLDMLFHTTMREPIYKEEKFDVHYMPEEGKSYVCVVDVSEGLKLDYSTISVIDVSSVPYRQVAKYRNNMIDPYVFPGKIWQIATKYNFAHVLVEINSVGLQVANTLHYDFGYENLIKFEVKALQGQQVSAGYRSAIQFGIRTTQPVRKTGCANLKALIEDDKLEIYDEETIMEFTTFSLKNGKYQAEEGNNDDLVMGLVHFAWLTNQAYFKQITDSDVRKALQEEQLRLRDIDILPPPIIQDEPRTMDGFMDEFGDFWTESKRHAYMVDDLNWQFRQYTRR